MLAQSGSDVVESPQQSEASGDFLSAVKDATLFTEKDASDDEGFLSKALDTFLPREFTQVTRSFLITQLIIRIQDTDINIVIVPS